MKTHVPSVRFFLSVACVAIVASGCAHEVGPESVEDSESPYADGYDTDGDTSQTGDDTPAAEETADCPTFPVAGLAVIVEDRDSVVCGAVVTAADGAYSETLQRVGVGSDCRYLGVFERAGVYTVTAAVDGFAPVELSGLEVAVDSCGDPLTRDATVQLGDAADPDDRPLPTDPTGPADPADPVDPVDPADPNNPTQPTDPTDPTTPTDPSDPAPPSGGTPATSCPEDVAVHEGSVALTDPADATLDAVDCVHGDLVLQGDALDGAPIANVWFVAGDLIVDGTALQDLADLDGIAEIGGTLRIANNPDLTSVDLDNLDAAAAVEARGNDELTELRLQGLSEVGSLVVENNALLERVDVRGVQVTLGQVRLASNPELDRVDADALSSVGGSFAIEGGLLGQIDAQQLETVGGDLRLVANADLDTLGGFDAVSTVSGDVVVTDNGQLTADRVDGWLSGVDVAGASLVCGNETGDACP